MEYAWWRDLFLVIPSGGAIWFGDGCGRLVVVVVVSRVKEVRKGDGEDMPR